MASLRHTIKKLTVDMLISSNLHRSPWDIADEALQIAESNGYLVKPPKADLDAAERISLRLKEIDILDLTDQDRDVQAVLMDREGWIAQASKWHEKLTRPERASGPDWDEWEAANIANLRKWDKDEVAHMAFQGGKASVQGRLDQAIDRIKDILKQDDAQAYKEAEKFLLIVEGDEEFEPIEW